MKLNDLGNAGKLKRQIRTSSFVVGKQYNKVWLDVTGDSPISMGGYSYPMPANEGQTADLQGYSSKERCQCIVCRKSKRTTVNGVCLDCQQSTKRRTS